MSAQKCTYNNSAYFCKLNESAISSSLCTGFICQWDDLMKESGYLKSNFASCLDRAYKLKIQIIVCLIKDLQIENPDTVNPQKRPAGLNLFLRVKMWVLLEFGPNLGIFDSCFLSFLWVLLECGSYSRAGLFRGFTVFHGCLETKAQGFWITFNVCNLCSKYPISIGLM